MAMPVFRRILILLFHPDAAWSGIAGERVTLDGLLRMWILPFSLIAPVMLVIGATVFDQAWNLELGYRVLPRGIYPVVLGTFLSSVAAVFMLAAIFSWIAPTFGPKPGFMTALKVAVFGSVPVWLASALLFLMPMIIAVLFAFLYSCYQYYIGVSKVLGIAADRAAEFVAISMLLLSLALMLAGAAGSWIGLL